jgi:hypothetical protein
VRWLQRTPQRAARDFVVRHPSLRQGARRTRDQLGRLRGLLLRGRRQGAPAGPRARPPEGP